MVRKFLAGLALVLYFCSTLWLSFGVPFTFTSPDENANFTFAQSLRAYGTLAVIDGVTQGLGGVAHPRSAVAVGSFIVPGSFIGLPFVAGLFGRIAGDVGMQYVTPLLVIIALLAWYDMLRVVFKEKSLATLATVLLVLHPALWYYAARPMMHNVGFVCFLIAAAWCIFAKPFTRYAKKPMVARAQLFEFALSGLFVGLALFFRLSEALWVLGSVIACLVYFRRQLTGVWPVALFVLGLALPLALNAGLNVSLYGSPFVNGYTYTETSVAVTSSIASEATITSSPSSHQSLLSPLLPFGFHEHAILHNVWNFGLALFPWFTVLAAAGLLLSLAERRTPWKFLSVLTLVLGCWLAVVYGSWSFNDNPDPTAVTLGDSHIRYWLPLFVLSTLFAARAVFEVASVEYRVTSKKGTLSRPVIISVVGIVAVLSALLVFGGDDGLLRTRQVLFASAAKRETVLSLTEEDAIIVVDRADKFLWPYRHVIQPLRNDTTYAALPSALAVAPLYYFGIPFPPGDLAHLNDVKLAALGLKIELVTLVDDEALYRITTRD